MLDSGSASSSSTRAPADAVAAARLIDDVVLPTPPFWLATRSLRTAASPTRRPAAGRAQAGPPIKLTAKPSTRGAAPPARKEQSAPTARLAPPVLPARGQSLHLRKF